LTLIATATFSRSASCSPQQAKATPEFNRLIVGRLTVEKSPVDKFVLVTPLVNGRDRDLWGGKHDDLSLMTVLACLPEAETIGKVMDVRAIEALTWDQDQPQDARNRHESL
jgi:hypothetical protein